MTASAQRREKKRAWYVKNRERMDRRQRERKEALRGEVARTGVLQPLLRRYGPFRDAVHAWQMLEPQGRPNSADYLRVYLNTAMRVFVHRAVMMVKLGRDLAPGEEVHHRDGNYRNNHPDNLVLCQDRSEHREQHGGGFGVYAIDGCLCYSTGPNAGKTVARVVMEQVLGRPLEPHEYVWHKNRNHRDNRVGNLEVISKSEWGRRGSLIGWEKRRKRNGNEKGV